MLLTRRRALILLAGLPLWSIGGGWVWPASGEESLRIPVLCYHRFGPRVVDSMTLQTGVFAAQLAWLRDKGYSVIPLRALVAHLRGEAQAPPGRSVVITADDGHRNVFAEMLPLVRHYQVPVTLFIYPSAISNATYAMTWDQLRELVATGLFEVQSHTYWHPKLRDERLRMTPEAYRCFLDMQFAKSKRRLEQEIGRPVDLLAWPFGLFDEDLERAASEAGYVAAFSIERRPVTRAERLMALPRYMIVAADGLSGFAEVVHGSGAGKAPAPHPRRRAPMSILGLWLSEHRTPTPGPLRRWLRVGGLAGCLAWLSTAWGYEGRLVDAQSGAPIPEAIVTLGERTVRSDEGGRFHIEGEGDTLKFRAPGFGRLAQASRDWPSAGRDLPLPRLRPQALYLTVYGIGNCRLRDEALETVRRNGLNALVIDVKGDAGLVPFDAGVPLTNSIGARRLTTIKNIQETITDLKGQGLYLIARIVVSKDDPLAGARPDLAVQAKGGGPYRDRERLRWVDPFQREVWDYNIALAKAAAAAGFDEIQFDYVRFPDTRHAAFSQPATEEARTHTITEFLRTARQALIPYNVFLAADVFGYVPWNANDTDIGQKIVPITETVDIVSLMVYPSGYHLGIPGYRNPVQHPYEIVLLTHKRAQERTKAPPIRFRPWLQAFRDYAFGGREFGAPELRLQIKAANDFGSNGWMIWNPRNVYPSDGYCP